MLDKVTNAINANIKSTSYLVISFGLFNDSSGKFLETPEYLLYVPFYADITIWNTKSVSILDIK
jgi:hypothetical protein